MDSYTQTNRVADHIETEPKKGGSKDIFKKFKTNHNLMCSLP